MESGLIFDIQGYSVHDGPGCRTLVFLSGCPLHCAWCANPEGQLLHPRLMYRRRRCRKDLRCMPACPYQAIQVVDGWPQFDHDRCNRCDVLACAAACLSEGLKIAGRSMTVDELLALLARDQGYWGSHGGVTFTGGEPFAQGGFLLAALQRCRELYMHTAVETCAHVNTGLLLAALPYLDWMFVDLKHMDPEAHRRGTGVSNEQILKNLAVLAHSEWTVSAGRLVVRIPLVPGFNDSQANLQASAEFLQGLGIKEVNLLPFHRLANSKYDQLGLDYAYAAQESPSKEQMHALKTIFDQAGMRCYLDFETPF